MRKLDKTFKVRFLGVRGSYPVPGKNTIIYGGNTTCHEVLVGGCRIILDGGTGIIPLGSELIAEHFRTKEPVICTMLFTHVHHDHTAGFLYFKPVYFKASRLAVLGHKTFAGSIKQALTDITVSPFHPVGLDEMGFKGQFGDLVGGEVLRLTHGKAMPEFVDDKDSVSPDDVIVRVVANPNHTKLGVLHYRVEYCGKSYVFATDVECTEDGEPTLTAFAKGADLLAHDGQYTDEDYYSGNPPKKGWGHSTIRMACATAEKAGVKRLAVIHHDPERTDAELEALEKEAKKYFADSFFARDGMWVEV